MAIAYFDCFSGISGDMVLGALVDAGGDAAVLDATVEALGLGDEVRVSTRREERGHLGGTRVTVTVMNDGSRTFPELEAAVAAVDAGDSVREHAVDALRRLGAAESELHGTPPEQLHLHELGGADTLVDLVGAFWLLDSLGVEEVYSSPLPAPRGTRGDMPLPAPASLRVLAGTGAQFEPSDAGRELVTPTGAAILASVARFERPTVQLRAIGYGFGANPAATNALAVWVGESGGSAGTVEVLETNLDDMTPADLAALADDLMAAGALDVTVTPTVMKKGRAAHALSVMAAPATTAALADLVMRRSTTLGLRVSRVPRVLAEREVITVETALGRARVKVKRWAGTVEVAAEHDDVRMLAADARDLGSVRRLVEDAARRQLGIG